MIKWLFLMILPIAVLSSCGEYQVKYGEVRTNGSVLYPLCERARQRITDMQRINFELPELFKRAQCRNWPDYSYNSRADSLHIEIPGVISNESVMSVGGVYSMFFYSGYVHAAYYLPADEFFDDYRQYPRVSHGIASLVTASWIGWQGGRCARFYYEGDNGLYLLRRLEYVCWESVSGSSLPFHIGVSEKSAPGRTPTNLDKEFIEPVLNSLQINPVPVQRLALWDSYRADFCGELKGSYDNKTGMGKGSFSDSLNRKRAIRFLRGCGYQMPDPVGPENWGELFRPNGQLIGKADGAQALRKVSHTQLAELEAALMSLQLKLAEKPDVRYFRVSGRGSFLIEDYKSVGRYSGNWYRVPPYYNEQNGFGIRDDPVLGRVIDVNLEGFPVDLRVMGE